MIRSFDFGEFFVEFPKPYDQPVPPALYSILKIDDLSPSASWLLDNVNRRILFSKPRFVQGMARVSDASLC